MCTMYVHAIIIVGIVWVPEITSFAFGWCLHMYTPNKQAEHNEHLYKHQLSLITVMLFHSCKQFEIVNR